MNDMGTLIGSVVLIIALCQIVDNTTAAEATTTRILFLLISTWRKLLTTTYYYLSQIVPADTISFNEIKMQSRTITLPLSQVAVAEKRIRRFEGHGSKL
jgi:hypothetical protein